MRIRRSGILLGLALGLLLALAVAALPGSAHSALAASPSSISGTVVNGTQGNAPLTNQQVTLQAKESAAGQGDQTSAPVSRDLISVSTDAQGHFTFSDVPAGTSDVFAIYTRYQGGLYSSQAITVAAGTSQTVTLTAYDATTDTSALSISNVTLLVRPPDVPHGLIGIGEFVTFQNRGNTAFVGNANAAAGSMPPLLRFAVPAGSSNLTPGAGFVGAQILTIGTGFGATVTVPPGASVFAFAYDLPYTGTSATYTYQAVYPTAQVVILVPPTMHARPGNFVAQGTVPAFDQTYQVFQAGTTKPDASISLQLVNLPRAGEASDLNFGLLLALGALLALLAGVALGMAFRRGDLSFLAARFACTSAESDTALAAIPGERERLLREIAWLASSEARRTLSAPERERRIAELRAEARGLLADDLESQTRALEGTRSLASAGTARTAHGAGEEDAR